MLLCSHTRTHILQKLSKNKNAPYDLLKAMAELDSSDEEDEGSDSGGDGKAAESNAVSSKRRAKGKAAAGGDSDEEGGGSSSGSGSGSEGDDDDDVLVLKRAGVDATEAGVELTKGLLDELERGGGQRTRGKSTKKKKTPKARPELHLGMWVCELAFIFCRLVIACWVLVGCLWSLFLSREFVE